MCDKQNCKRPASAEGCLSSRNMQFCSIQHRDQTINLLLNQDLERIDGLLNKIFLLEPKWLQPRRICGARRMQTGSLLLFQQDFDMPLIEQEDSITKILREFEEIGDSFNACVHVMEVFSGVLAYFAEGSFLVQEADVFHVKSDIPFLVIDFDPGTDGNGQDGDHKALYQCQRHSMFMLSSPIGDFFLDPTAPQYDRTQGKQKRDDYLRRYGHPGFRWPDITTFGSMHEKMLERAREHPEGSQAWCDSMFKQIVACTINDAIYEETKRVEGLAVFREGTDAAWKAVEAGILTRLDADLSKLRHELDQVWYGNQVFDDQYRRLFCQAHGPGHCEMMAALIRMMSDRK